MDKQESLEELVMLENRLNELKKEVNEIEKAKAEVVEEIMQYMEQRKVDKIETKDIRVTYVKASTRKSLDVEKLKEEYSIADIPEDCYKETIVKPRVNIKLL